MRLDFKPERLLRYRERPAPSVNHPGEWRARLRRANLRRKMVQVFVGIFAGSAVFALIFRLLFPNYQFVYPQVLTIEAAVAFIVLYFFVPELVDEDGRDLPLASVFSRLKRALGGAFGGLRQAMLMALLASASILPLAFLLPATSTTIVKDIGVQPPAPWLAHFLAGDAAFFGYLLVAVAVAYVVRVIIGSNSLYRFLLVFLTLATLPQAKPLWEPAGFYIRWLNDEQMQEMLASFSVESMVLDFHETLASPPPFWHKLPVAILGPLLFIRLFMLSFIVAYVASLVASVIRALRPIRGLGTGLLNAVGGWRLPRCPLLRHLLGCLVVIGLATIAVIFFGWYAEVESGRGTARPVAVLTLWIIAVIAYIVARATARSLQASRQASAGLPLALVMRSHIALSVSYSLVLVFWGSVNLGILTYLLGLSRMSLVAVLALVLVAAAALQLIGLVVIALSRQGLAVRFSAMVAGFTVALGLAAGSFLLYPPERPLMLLRSRLPGGYEFAASFNQLLLLERLNYPSAFDRWLRLSELAAQTPPIQVWLVGSLLAVMLIEVALMWLTIRLSSRLA